MTILFILLTLLFVCSFMWSWNDLNDQWSRLSWLTIGCGLLMAAASPNPWVGLLIGVFVTGTIFTNPMIVTVRETVTPTLMLAGTYLLIAPKMTEAMVVPILYGLVGLGLVITLWALYALMQPQGKFERQWAFLTFWERDADYPMAGQGNWNHTQSLSAVAVAANLGLIFLGETWTWACLPLVLLGLIICSSDRKWTSQGMVHLFTASVAGLGVWLGPLYGGLIAVAYIGAMLWVGKPWQPTLTGVDSGRFWSWRLAMQDLWLPALFPRDPTGMMAHAEAQIGTMQAVYQQMKQERQAIESGALPLPKDLSLDEYLGRWDMGNRDLHQRLTVTRQQISQWEILAKRASGSVLTEPDRMFLRYVWSQKIRVWRVGVGTHTWFHLTKNPVLAQTATPQPNGQMAGMVFIVAHNEYVEWWFEHGIIGLLALLGFLGTTLYALAVAGPVGQAVLVVALTLCSVAFLNFPWTLFQETPPNMMTPGPVQYIGAPSLMVVSLVIALLAAAVTG